MLKQSRSPHCVQKTKGESDIGIFKGMPTSDLKSPIGLQLLKVCNTNSEMILETTLQMVFRATFQIHV